MGKIILLILSILMFLLGVVAVLYYQENYQEIFYKKIISIKFNKVSNCSNLSLVDTAFCMRKYVSTFYNYTRRDERNYTGDDGNLEDIKVNGGDCYDYSRIYQTLAKELGYKSKKISIFPDKGAGHAFVVIWNTNLTEYCTIDILNVDCHKMIENAKSVKN